jgi:hypothetical protein
MNNNAAKKIQTIVRRRNPINTITLDRIKGSWYVMWFRDPKKGVFNVYSPETVRQLNKNPYSQRPKKKSNMILRAIPGRPSTTRPRFLNSNSNNNFNGLTTAQNAHNQFVAFYRPSQIRNMSSAQIMNALRRMGVRERLIYPTLELIWAARL